jgi:hypothetical protein
MTFKELKNKIKEEQKTLAQKIKEQKGKRKGSPDGYVQGLEYDRFQYRHIHIAYCTFFNNTPYDMIEQNCHEDPSEKRIDSLKEDWSGKIDEALRDCA